jgi:hypothetical protein
MTPANEAIVASRVKPIVLRQIGPWRTRTQDPKDTVEHAAVIYLRNAARLARQHRLDRGPFIIGEFVAHDSSLLRTCPTFAIFSCEANVYWSFLIIRALLWAGCWPGLIKGALPNITLKKPRFRNQRLSEYFQVYSACRASRVVGCWRSRPDHGVRCLNRFNVRLRRDLNFRRSFTSGRDHRHILPCRGANAVKETRAGGALHATGFHRLPGDEGKYSHRPIRSRGAPALGFRRRASRGDGPSRRRLRRAVAVGPGVQIEADTARATKLARRCNDRLALETRKRPDRYGGFAHLALQDPQVRRRTSWRAV